MLPLRVLRVRVAFSAPTTRVTGVCTPAVTPAAPVVFPDEDEDEDEDADEDEDQDEDENEDEEEEEDDDDDE